MREKYGWMYVLTCCSASSHGGLCNMQYIISKINDHGGISCIQMHRKYVCVCIGLNKRIIDVQNMHLPSRLLDVKVRHGNIRRLWSVDS